MLQRWVLWKVEVWKYGKNGKLRAGLEMMGEHGWKGGSQFNRGPGTLGSGVCLRGVHAFTLEPEKWIF